MPLLASWIPAQGNLCNTLAAAKCLQVVFACMPSQQRCRPEQHLRQSYMVPGQAASPGRAKQDTNFVVPEGTPGRCIFQSAFLQESTAALAAAHCRPQSTLWPPSHPVQTGSQLEKAETWTISGRLTAFASADWCVVCVYACVHVCEPACVCGGVCVERAGSNNSPAQITQVVRRLKLPRMCLLA